MEIHINVIFIIFSLCICVCEGLHLKGRWKSTDFYLFLTKFGFQKTDPEKLIHTQGVIYGNITTDANYTTDLQFVVVDSEYFMQFYGNRTLATNEACPKMFNKIDSLAFDVECVPNGTQDFLRKVPCKKGKLCTDEDNPSNVIEGYQFTYKVRDTERPRFWYISLVSCYRDSTGEKKCGWSHNKDQHIYLDYDIWLVNGDPSAKHLNPFEHQFSFELHDVFEIHLIVVTLCALLFAVWVYAFLQQRHQITNILTLSIALEIFGISCDLLHVTVFAFNGWGVTWLWVVGNFILLVSECVFMLFLLLVAKGWQITTNELSRRKVFFSMWGTYTVLNLVLFVWNLTEVDIISNTDEWQTYPGYLTLAFRLVVMVWFIVELRQTFHQGLHQDRLDFFQHFGAFFLVWFVHLPVLVLISTQISALWRYKTILSISYAADVLAYAVLIHLLWPTRSVLYLIKGEIPLPTYDLEITGLLDDLQETAIFNKSSVVMEGQDFNSEDELFGNDCDEKKNQCDAKLQNGRIANGGITHIDGVAVLNESVL